jgi:S-layer homology domain
MASPQPPSPENKPISLDEWIAVALAFSVIGAILCWSIAKNSQQIKIANFSSLLTSPSSPPSKKLLESKPTTPTVIQPLPTATISPFLYSHQPEQHKLPLVFPGTKITSSAEQGSFKIEKPLAKIAKSPAKSSATAKLSSPQTVPIKFSDVSDKYWAKPFIEDLAKREIIAGFKNGKFQPEKPVTRAELASIIEAIAGQGKVTQKLINFQDVKANSWHFSAINKSVQSGFLKGYPGNIFRPDQSMTKVQVLSALASGFNLKSPAKLTKTLEIYQDSQKIPTWALKQVAAATEANLVVNYPKRDFLNPNQPINRADVAAIVYQTLVKLEKAKPLPSDYIVSR